MTTAPQKKNLRNSSDFYRESSKICQPCLFEGKRLQADRFCADCNEFLCKKCSQYHKALKTTRNHFVVSTEEAKNGMAIISKDASDESADTPPVTAKDKCSFKCDVHPEKIIKFYCGSEQFLGCSVCITKEHKQYESIDYIPNEAENIKNNVDFKRFDGKIRALSVLGKACIADADTNLAHVEADEKHLKQAMAEFRKKLNEAFDELEAQLIKEAKEVNIEETKRLNVLSNTLEESLVEIDLLIQKVDHLLSTGRNCDIYVLMKKEANHLVALNEGLINATRSKTLKRYSFQQNKDVLEPGTFGKLSVRGETVKYCPENTKRFYVDGGAVESTDTDTEPKTICPGTKVKARHSLLDGWCGKVEYYDGRCMGWKVKWDNGITFNYHADDLEMI